MNHNGCNKKNVYSCFHGKLFCQRISEGSDWGVKSTTEVPHLTSVVTGGGGKVTAISGETEAGDATCMSSEDTRLGPINRGILRGGYYTTFHRVKIAVCYYVILWSMEILLQGTNKLYIALARTAVCISWVSRKTEVKSQWGRISRIQISYYRYIVWDWSSLPSWRK